MMSGGRYGRLAGAALRTWASQNPANYRGKGCGRICVVSMRPKLIPVIPQEQLAQQSNSSKRLHFLVAGAGLPRLRST